LYPLSYIEWLLDRARVLLRGSSPKKAVGQGYVADIEHFLAIGAPQEQYSAHIGRLRVIVDQLAEERAEANGRRTMGVLVRMHPEYKKFVEWADTLSDRDRKRAISMVSKGEYYG
jgi:hypothetical protein